MHGNIIVGRIALIICQCERGPDDAHASGMLALLRLLQLRTPYIVAHPALVKSGHV